MIIKVVFESQGRGKMAETWLQENANISPKKTNLRKIFININKKINLLHVKLFQDAHDQLLSNQFLNSTIFH